MISVPFQNPLAITLDNTNQAIRVSLLCAEMSFVSSGPQGTPETSSNFLTLLELRPLEFQCFGLWSCVFKIIIPSITRILPLEYGEDLLQIQFSICAYDGDKV